MLSDSISTIQISIHTLQAEGDKFYLPAKGHLHISIHTLQAEGDPDSSNFIPSQSISIHTLQAEGDNIQPAQFLYALHFNPHPPSGG